MANLERRRAVDSPGEDEDHEEQQEREGVEAQLDDGDLVHASEKELAAGEAGVRK